MSKAVTQGERGPSGVNAMCSHNEEPAAICQGQECTLYRSMIIAVFDIHQPLEGSVSKTMGDTENERARKHATYHKEKNGCQKMWKNSFSASHNFTIINILQVISSLLHMC